MWTVCASPDGRGWCRDVAGVSGSLLDLGEKAEKAALLAVGEGGADHETFPGMHRREQLVDDGSSVAGDVNEELAAIRRVRQPLDQPALLEVVQQ